MPSDRRLLAALALALLTSPALAQVERFNLSASSNAARSERPHPAVVRVIAPGRDGVSYGSGTLLDVNDSVGLIVTNWHVVQGATSGITVVFADGFRSAAQVLKTDPDWDLAALVCARPNAIPVRVANSAPQPGEALTIAGYGMGEYRSASGRVTQYLAPSADMPYEIVEMTAHARQGDSGGPIFNSRGELAGVLFGESKGLTSGSYCGRVDRFLRQSFASMAVAATPPPVPRAAEPLSSLSDDGTSVFSEARPLATIATPVTAERATTKPAFPSAPSSPQAQTSVGQLAWDDIVGRTPIEAAKTVLSAVGLIALIALLLRRPASPPEPEAMPVD
jgi:hypothetical protein